jgi:hypothetical protein
MALPTTRRVALYSIQASLTQASGQQWSLHSDISKTDKLAVRYPRSIELMAEYATIGAGQAVLESLAFNVQPLVGRGKVLAAQWSARVATIQQALDEGAQGGIS